MTPTTLLAIFTSILSTVEGGLALVRRLGIAPDAVDELERLKAEINASAAKLLPGSIIALNAIVQVTAADLNAKIEALGETPRCPGVFAPCGNILTQHILKDVHSKQAAITLKCDRCDWTGVVRARA